MGVIVENVKIVSKTGTLKTGGQYKNVILSSDIGDPKGRTSENGWIGNTLKITSQFQPGYNEFKQQFPGVEPPKRLVTTDKNVWGWGYWINKPEEEAKKIEDIKKLAAFLNQEKQNGDTGHDDVSDFDSIEKVDGFIKRMQEMITEINLSDEQKQNELKAGIQKFINELANAVDAVSANEKLAEYFEWAQKFPNYSFNNQILIWIQKPDAKKVNSKTGWSTLGLKPKEGAYQIWLWRPVLKPATEFVKKMRREAFFKKYKINGAPTPKQQDLLDRILKQPVADHSKRPILYPTYDIADVVDEQGNPGQMAAKSPLEWTSDQESETADKISEAMYRIYKNYNIDFEFYVPTGGEGGYSAGGKIRIAQGAHGVEGARVAIHEFSHEIIHQSYIKSKEEEAAKNGKVSEKTKHILDAYEGRTDIRAIRELQADGVTYVVMRQFGFPDLQHNVNYIAGWGGTSESILGNLNVVMKTANLIITELNTQLDSHMDEPDPTMNSGEFGDHESEPEEPTMAESDVPGDNQPHGKPVSLDQVANMLKVPLNQMQTTAPVHEFVSAINEAKNLFKSILKG